MNKINYTFFLLLFFVQAHAARMHSGGEYSRIPDREIEAEGPRVVEPEIVEPRLARPLEVERLEVEQPVILNDQDLPDQDDNDDN